MKNFLIGLLCLFAVSAWAAQPRVNGVEVIQALNGTATNTTFPTNTFAIGTIYSGRGAYAFYGDDEELLWGGIRTNSTLAKLATYAYRGTSSSGSNSHLLVELQNDNYGLLEFGANTGSGQSAALRAESTFSQMDFSLMNNNIQKVFLRANTSGGFVGINTNAPQANLHVEGDAIITKTLSFPILPSGAYVLGTNLTGQLALTGTDVDAFHVNSEGSVEFFEIYVQSMHVSDNMLAVNASLTDPLFSGTTTIRDLSGYGDVVAADASGTLYRTKAGKWVAAPTEKALERNNFFLHLQSVSMNTVFAETTPQLMFSNRVPFNGGIATSIGNNWMNRQGSNVEVITYNSGTNFGGWGGIGGPWWDILAITNDGPASVVQWNSLNSNTTFTANYAGVAYLSMPGLGWFSNQISVDNGASWTTLLAVNARAAAGQTNWYWTNFSISASTTNKYRIVRQNGTNAVVSSIALMNTNRYGWSWFPAAIGSWNIDNVYTNWWGSSANMSNFFSSIPKADALVWLTGRPTDTAVTNSPRFARDVFLPSVGTNGDIYYLGLWANGVVADNFKNMVHNNVIAQEARRIGAMFLDAESWFDQTNYIYADGLYTDGVHTTSPRGAWEYASYFWRSSRAFPYLTNWPDVFVNHPQMIYSPTVSALEMHWTNGNKFVVLPKPVIPFSSVAGAAPNSKLTTDELGNVIWVKDGDVISETFDATQSGATTTPFGGSGMSSGGGSAGISATTVAINPGLRRGFWRIFETNSSSAIGGTKWSTAGGNSGTNWVMGTNTGFGVELALECFGAATLTNLEFFVGFISSGNSRPSAQNAGIGFMFNGALTTNLQTFTAAAGSSTTNIIAWPMSTNMWLTNLSANINTNTGVVTFYTNRVACSTHVANIPVGMHLFPAIFCQSIVSDASVHVTNYMTVNDLYFRR